MIKLRTSRVGLLAISACAAAVGCEQLLALDDFSDRASSRGGAGAAGESASGAGAGVTAGSSGGGTGGASGGGGAPMAGGTGGGEAGAGGMGGSASKFACVPTTAISPFMSVTEESSINVLGPEFGIALGEDGAYFGVVGHAAAASYTITVFAGANAAEVTRITTTEQPVRPAAIVAGAIADGMAEFYGTTGTQIVDYPVVKSGDDYYVGEGTVYPDLPCDPINRIQFSPPKQFLVNCGGLGAQELWHGGWGLASPTRIADTSSLPTSYVGSASHHFMTEVSGFRATDANSPTIAQLATKRTVPFVDDFDVGGLVQVAGRGANDEGVFVLVRGIESNSPYHYKWYAGTFAEHEYAALEAESVPQLSLFAKQTGDDAVVYYRLSQNDVSTIATGSRVGGGIRFTYFDRSGKPLAVDVPVTDEGNGSGAQAFQLDSDGRVMVVWTDPTVTTKNRFYYRRYDCSVQ